MSFETEARRHTTPDAVNPAADSNREDFVSAPRSDVREPEPGAEQPSLREESFVIDRTQGAASGSANGPALASQPEKVAPVFDQTVAQDFRSRWNEIQVAFVDEPRDAVRSADRLVAETIKELTDSFTSERQKLEEESSRDSEDSTEALRLAFQRYRSYFHRLLAV